MEYADISLPLPHVDTLTYSVPFSMQSTCKVGCRVRVPLGNRQVTGVVMQLHKQNPQPQAKLKAIISVLDTEPVVDSERILLSKFISNYYFAPLYDCIKLCLPADTVKKPIIRYALTELGKKDPLLKNVFARKRILEQRQLIDMHVALEDIQSLLSSGLLVDATVEKRGADGNCHASAGWHPAAAPSDLKSLLDSRLRGNDNHHTLTHDQQTAVETITTHSSHAFLLEGPCGSGKTEVYARVARAMLQQNKGVLILLPEISLTPQLHRYFTSVLETEIVMLHSGISSKERNESFFKLLHGQARVVVGARSAVFSPIQNLGLVVVDEEHDQSYKQDESPRYHARDVALWRAHHHSAKIILGSATPSFETILNAQRAKLVHVKLSERINKSIPQVKIVDLRARGLHKHTKLADKARSDGQSLCIISEPLREAITHTLRNGEQAMILLNRRGYAAFALCTSCGEVVRCDDCSVSLTYHKKNNALQCHQCDHYESLVGICKKCDGSIITLGLGTERVEQELQQLFPTARIARLDRDTTTTHNKLLATLESMREGSVDILVGTQMIAKGHDFPAVSLVGVVLAEIGLAVPDFRASERTFQLMVQIAGRAGRAQTAGMVIVQTFNPEHLSLKLAQRQNVKAFADYEMPMRQGAFLPPYTHAAMLRVEGIHETGVQLSINLVAQHIKRYTQNEGMRMLGPAPCPIEKIRGKVRHQLALYFSKRSERIQCVRMISDHREIMGIIKKNKCRLVVDIDPLRMM